MDPVDFFLTHNDIAEQTGIGLAKVQRMGAAGLLGKRLSKRPALYRQSAIGLAIKHGGDARLKVTDIQVADIKRRVAKGLGFTARTSRGWFVTNGECHEFEASSIAYASIAFNGH